MLVGVAVSLWLIRAMESDTENRSCHVNEPWWLRMHRPAELNDPLSDDAYIGGTSR
jgi:hypothetical protein